MTSSLDPAAPGNLPARTFSACIALLWLLGAWLRLWELGQQPVLGDELHALNSAVEGNLGTILAERGLPDVSIPIALWNYLLVKSQCLNEWTMRLPMLLAGLAFLPLITRFAFRHGGQATSLAATGLAAISPLLILYSRFSRPYMLITLLSLLTLLMWMAHIKGHGFAWALALLSTLLSATLTPVVLPALGTLAGSAILIRWISDLRNQRIPFWKQAWREHRILCLLSIVGAVGLGRAGAPQASAMLSGAQQFAQRTASRDYSIRWNDVGEILVGVSSPTVAFLVGMAAMVGLVAGLRKARALTVMIVLMSAVQIFTINFFVYWGYQVFSLARYCIVLLPGLLFLTGMGLSCLTTWSTRSFISRQRSAQLQGPLLASVLIALLSWGPHKGLFRSHNSFTGIWPTAVAAVPAYGHESHPAWPHFYTFLANLDEDVTILEAPSISSSRKENAPYASYQREHRKRVTLLNRRPTFRNEGVRLSSTRPALGPPPYDFGGASIVIIHKNLPGERAYIAQIRAALPSDKLLEGTLPRDHSDPLAVKTNVQSAEQAERLITNLAKDRTLEVLYDDKWIRVFTRDPDLIKRLAQWESER